MALDGGRLEERLGGDASTVETGAAERILLDHRHCETGGSAVQGGGVTARTATDHDQIERVTHSGNRSGVTAEYRTDVG